MLTARIITTCKGLRAWFRHLIDGRFDCLLGRQDWPFSAGQEDCQGALVRKRHLVRTEVFVSLSLRGRSHDATHADISWQFFRWGPVNKPMSPDVRLLPFA